MRYEVIRLDHVQCHEPTPFFLDVSCNVYRGEMLCMLIQNEMRSRALVGLLSGEQCHQGGHLYIGDQEVTALTPETARQMGVYCIICKPTLIPTLSVAENLFLSRDLFYQGGIFRRRLMEAAAAEWLSLAGVEGISPRAKVGELDTAHAHIIEILKAAVQGARLIVLDNIYKFYSDNQRQMLFSFLRRFKENPSFDVSLWSISDSYSQLWTLADRGALLRRGRCVAVLPAEKLSHAVVTNITSPVYSKDNGPLGLPVREVFSLHQVAASKPLFRLETGGVKGILDQNQRFRFLDLSNAGKRLSPNMQAYLDGVKLTQRQTIRALKHQVCILNCHEISDSIIESMNLYQNVMLRMGRPIYGFLWRERRRMMEFTTHHIFRQYDLLEFFEKFKGRNHLRDLSNSEKFFVFLARLVVRQPRVLIVIDPQICFEETQYPHFVALMHRVCAQGIALAVISSTQDILLSVSDQYDILEKE